MNPISIDIQSYFSYAVLAETSHYDINYSVVGDGYRASIPHAFHGGQWGTAALGSGQAWPIGSPPFYDLYRNRERAAVFFKGYYRHLTEFLGMTEPLRRNGYEPVMIIHTGQFPEDSQTFRQAMRREHCFPEVDFIPSDLALLCRWLATASVSEPLYILPVVIGENLTTMSLYHLQKQGGKMMAPEFKGQASFPVGFMNWLDEFGRMLSHQLNGLRVEATVSLHDNLLDFLYRMQSNTGEKHLWSGLYKKELGERIGLPDDGVFDTPLFSFSGLVHWLEKTPDQLLKNAIPGISTQMIIGGKGALFPFDRQKGTSQVPVEKIPLPLESVALGGLLWPSVRKMYPALLKQIQTSSSQAGDNINYKRIIP